MKKTKKIAMCGMLAAFITVICLAAYFPYLTYALPALAGAVIIVPLFEMGKKYAFFTYLTSLLPVLIFAENEAKLLYVCFFGFYPILKSVYEKSKSRIAEYTLKFLTFNISVITVYILLSKLFFIDMSDMGVLGKYGAVILLVCGNVVFFIYDICLARLAIFYQIKLRRHLTKFFK